MSELPPEGYVDPSLVWCVETEVRLPNGELDHVIQLGAFSSEDEALKLLDRLKAEARFTNVHLNPISVHQRIEDWDWDR